jgi:hypothetical protein
MESIHRNVAQRAFHGLHAVIVDGLRHSCSVGHWAVDFGFLSIFLLLLVDKFRQENGE